MSIRYATFWAGAVSALLSCAAHASVSYGAYDSAAQLTWIKASTLDEGYSLGFRAATAGEFSAYLTQGGFGTPSSTQEFFSRTVVAPRMGFAVDTYVQPSMPYEYNGPAVTMAWLDGGAKLGALMNTTGKQQSQCYPGDYNYRCYSAIYVNEAAYGTLGEMLAGQHDGYSYGVGGDWKGALAAIKSSKGDYSLDYFMVSSVPEPGSWLMMGLGLAGLAALQQRKARSTH